MHNYALLTIGDGLVAQIPSLLLSTAAAIMVTRVATTQDMAGQIMGQMFTAPRALAIAAFILILLGLIPGMPHIAFLGLGSLPAGLAYWIWKGQQQVAEEDSGQFPARGGGRPAAVERGQAAGDPRAGVCRRRVRAGSWAGMTSHRWTLSAWKSVTG